MGDEAKIFQELINTCVFPIAAFYLMYQMHVKAEDKNDATIKENNKAIQENTQVLGELKEVIRGLKGDDE